MRVPFIVPHAFRNTLTAFMSAIATTSTTLGEPRLPSGQGRPRGALAREALVRFLPLALAAGSASSSATTLIDDSFISFRYAANFAEGLGLVFNAGERVEGISNLGWTLLLSCVHRLNLPLQRSAWFLGVCFLLISIALTQRLTTVITGHRGFGLASALLLALNVDLVDASLLGLETSLYSALILGTLATIDLRSRHATWGFVACATGAAITRPEGAPLAFGFALLALTRRSPEIHLRRQQWMAAAAIVLLILAVEVWRWCAFHEFIPMSALAKMSGGALDVQASLATVLAGARYVGSAFGAGPAVVLCGLAVVGRSRRVQLPSTLSLRAALLALGWGIIVAVENGGDWMPNHRLLMPSLPVLVFLLCVAAHHLRKAFDAACLAALLIIMMLQPGPQSRLRRQPAARHAEALVEETLGSVSRENALPADVLASGFAGRFAFYARPARVLEVFGLTDPRIAKLPRRANVFGKEAPDVVAALRPELVHHNFWPFLRDVALHAPGQYQAVVATALTSGRSFLIVRRDVAARLGAPIARRFGGQIEELDSAIETWRRSAPKGQ